MPDDNSAPAAPLGPWTRRSLVGLLLAYWLTWVIITHWPKIPLPAFSPHRIDKVLHFIGYTLLAFLLSFMPSVARRRLVRPTRAEGLVILATIAVAGILDELTQPWFGRSFEWGDYAADLLGGAAGLALFHAFVIWRNRRWRRAAASAGPSRASPSEWASR